MIYPSLTLIDAETGIGTGRSISGPPDFVAANTPAGHVALALDAFDHRRQRVAWRPDDFGDAVPTVVRHIPPEPDTTEWVSWAWDADAWQWASSPTLAALRLTVWQRIKLARSAAESAPITLGALTFDADASSQQRIAGAVQMAQLATAAGRAAEWSITWTLADNTSAEMTAWEVIDLGLAVAAQISAAHARGRVLRAQIDAAQTPGELDAIVW